MKLIDRVRMALAEAGYPNAAVDGDDDDPSVLLGNDARAVPDRVCWQAFKVVGYGAEQPCFACWGSGVEERCEAPGLGVDDCGRVREVAC